MSQDPARDVTALAAQLFEHVRSGAWDDAAALYDAEELAGFQKLQLQQLLSGLIDISDGETGKLKETEELAPYMLDPFKLLPEVGSRPVFGWPELGTIQQLAELSPDVFFARYLEAQQRVLSDIAMTRIVVAVAVESPELAHVLYRRDQKSDRQRAGRYLRFHGIARPWVVTVLSFRKTPSGWAALPNDDLSGEWLAKMLHFLDRDPALAAEEDEGASGEKA